jgi:hypothetical protein
VRPQGAHCDIGAVETFPIDLISHNGLEACWSHGAGQARVPRTHTYHGRQRYFLCAAVFHRLGPACFTPACPGAVVGCPVTIHSGPFTDGSSFIAGRFSASGSADNVTVPALVVPGRQLHLHCEQYRHRLRARLRFHRRRQSRRLCGPGEPVAATVTNWSFTRLRHSRLPNRGRNVGSVFAAYVQATLSIYLRQNLQTATASQSVCPLSP